MNTTDRVLAALLSPRVLALDELRALLNDPVDFGPAVFALEDAGRVVLYRDCDAAGIDPARRALLLSEGDNVFTCCSLR